MTQKPLDLEPIKARASVIAAMSRPMPISRLEEAFAWANTDRGALIAEVERLRSIIERTYCAYCGAEFKVDAPDSTEAVTTHIRTCANHPMRHVEAEVERLRAALLKYGEHSAGCYAYDGRTLCNCGFTRVLLGKE